MAGAGQHLLLLDVAILRRTTDGSYTLNREPFPLTCNVLAGGTLGFLAGVALAAPIVTNAAIEAMLGSAASTLANAVGIEDAFIGFLDVLDAERSLFASEDAMAESDGAISLDLVALYKALGGGWEAIEKEAPSTPPFPKPPMPAAGLVER